MRLLRTQSSMVMMVMCLLGLVSATSGQAPTPHNGSFDVVSFGAKADGKTDDTAAIQKALDAAGKHGGVVRLPAGKFLVAGSLKIPVGVALAGSNQAPVYYRTLDWNRHPHYRWPGQGGCTRPVRDGRLVHGPRTDRLLPRPEARRYSPLCLDLSFTYTSTSSYPKLRSGAITPAKDS